MQEEFANLLHEKLKKLEYSRFQNIKFCIDDIGLRFDGQVTKVLVLQEPPAVMPENYVTKDWEFFDFVILLSPWRSPAHGMNTLFFQPIERPKVIFKENEVNNNEISLVNDFKFGAVTTSLYGWRLDLLRKLEKNGVKVKVFGPNWRISKTMEIRKRWAATKRAFGRPNFKLRESWSSLFFRPKGYVGHSSDKLETLSKHEFTLVIENDRDSLTEKLFDAIFSGTKVFYRGPNLGDFAFLEGLCFQLPEDIEEAVRVILDRQQINWDQYRQRAMNFVADPNSMLFCSPTNVSNQIAKFLENCTQRP